MIQRPDPTKKPAGPKATDPEGPDPEAQDLPEIPSLEAPSAETRALDPRLDDRRKNGRSLEPQPQPEPEADSECEPEAESGREPDSGLVAQIEALLFTAKEPLSIRRLAELSGDDTEIVRRALDALKQRYSGECGVHLLEIGSGYRLLTNPDCAPAVAALHGKKARERLSPAALETLAIVAYKQPISRAEIERVRGVGVGPVVRHLLELDLVKVIGREDGLGRALLYATTRSFLDRFGLKNLKDLPASLEL